MTLRFAYLLGLAAATLHGTGQAQESPELPPPIVVKIRPAAAPVPALKYLLLPPRRELVPGNAAIFYHRAIEMEMQWRTYSQRRPAGSPRSAGSPSVEERISEWVEGPLRNIPREELRTQLAAFKNALHEVELGARRESCDWELAQRDEGYSLLIEEIQQARLLARLVSLQARLEILDGHLDKAVYWLQVGFALSRHVANGPTLIQSLAGAAIAMTMAPAVEDLIQAPGAPSLYWAVANLPRPFLDLGPALAGEDHLLERQIPKLTELEKGIWTLEQARTFSQEIREELGTLTGLWGRSSSGGGVHRIADWGNQVAFTAMMARAYPEAKRFLIAQGMPPAEVEAMPIIQVVAIHSYRLYQQYRDEIFKWAGLPFFEAVKGVERSEQEQAKIWHASKAGLPLGELLPAIKSVFYVPVRVGRRLDAIQTIEAIRLFAAAHNGALPSRLDEITEAPVPFDPGTGKPFDYRLEGNTATLSAPPPMGAVDYPGNRLLYKLQQNH
jgi:hypothetical protein